MKKIIRKVISSILVLGMLAAPLAVTAENSEVRASVQTIDLTAGTEKVRLGAGAVNYPIVKGSSLTGTAKEIYNYCADLIVNKSSKTYTKVFTNYTSSASASNAYLKAYYALSDTYFQYYSTPPMKATSTNYYYVQSGKYAYTKITLTFDNKAAKGRYKRSKDNKALVKTRTTNLLKGVTSTRTKVLRIRNHVVNKLSYKITSTGTLDTSLRGSLAKCSGYAALFQAMCLAAGIPCQQVTGNAGEGHDWNRVKIGSTWYWIDPTWYDTAKTNKAEWSLKKCTGSNAKGGCWSGRTIWAYLDTINFQSRGYTSAMFD